MDILSIVLEDVHSIEIKRRERERQWVFVGLVFIGGGFLLVMLSLFWVAMLISPLLMAVSLSLIGLVFLLTYVGNIRGEVIVTAGSARLKCRMKQKALDAMVIFLERFYELCLGVPNTSRFQGGTEPLRKPVDREKVPFGRKRSPLCKVHDTTWSPFTNRLGRDGCPRVSELVIDDCPRATPFGLEPHVTVADGHHRYFIGVFIGNDAANLTIEIRKPSPVTAWG